MTFLDFLKRTVLPPLTGPATGAKPSEGAGLGEWIWAPDGNGYFVAGLGERGHFAKLKGLSMIEKLVHSPGQPVLMILLVGGTAEKPKGDKHSKQLVMDRETLREVYNRCKVLRAEIEKDETEGRTVDADESRVELEQLKQQLKAAVGIKGKVRDLNDLANKLRPSIHGALDRVYGAMRKANPPLTELANHLKSAISSESATFVYRPAMQVSWKTAPSAQK
jgi:hypothetical protein